MKPQPILGVLLAACAVLSGQIIGRHRGAVYAPTGLTLEFHAKQPEDAFNWRGFPNPDFGAECAGYSDPDGGTDACLHTFLNGNGAFSADVKRTGVAPVIGYVWAKLQSGTSGAVPFGIVWDGGAEISQSTLNVTDGWQEFNISATPSGARTNARFQVGIGSYTSTVLYVYRRIGFTFYTGSLSGLTVAPPFTLIFVHRTVTEGADRTLWGGPASGNIQFRVNTADKLELLKAAQYAFSTKSTSSHATAAWVYSAVTYSAAGVYAFYLNGAADGGPTTDLQTFVNTSAPTIGYRATSTEPYHGWIAFGRVYDQALGAAQIAVDYAAVKSALAGWTPPISLP